MAPPDLVDGNAAASADATPAPGWYEDPDGTGLRRWWDGRGWTDALAPAMAPGFYPVPGDDRLLREWDGRSWTGASKPVTPYLLRGPWGVEVGEARLARSKDDRALTRVALQALAAEGSLSGFTLGGRLKARLIRRGVAQSVARATLSREAFTDRAGTGYVRMAALDRHASLRRGFIALWQYSPVGFIVLSFLLTSTVFRRDDAPLFLRVTAIVVLVAVLLVGAYDRLAFLVWSRVRGPSAHDARLLRSMRPATGRSWLITDVACVVDTTRAMRLARDVVEALVPPGELAFVLPRTARAARLAELSGFRRVEGGERLYVLERRLAGAPAPPPQSAL